MTDKQRIDQLEKELSTLYMTMDKKVTEIVESQVKGIMNALKLDYTDT